MSRTRFRRAVFLDRDGTIARDVSYCRSPEEFQLLPDAGKAIRLMNRAGLLVVVVTNQSGIARGFLTIQTLEAIHEKMRRELGISKAQIDAIYVCPHHPDAGCPCRKPGIALFRRASQELRVSLEESYMVGDRMLDVLSGRSAGARAILVRSGHKPEPPSGVVPDYEASTLLEVAEWILEQERRRVHDRKSRMGGRAPAAGGRSRAAEGVAAG